MNATTQAIGGRTIRAKTTTIMAVLFVGYVGWLSSASAAQVIFQNACSFSEIRHEFLGDTRLDYKVDAGTIFRQQEKDGVLAFCGPTKLHMPPLGWGPTEECVEINNGSLAELPGSNFKIQSDCAVAQPLQIPYRAIDFTAWQGQGAATLHGQAFLKTVGGDVKTCAGEYVALIPANTYYDQFLQAGSVADLSSINLAAKAQVRKTICDAQGNFSFMSVPAGKWYVLTDVTWGVPHIEQPGENPGLIGVLLFGMRMPPLTDQQGGTLLQSIDLKPGENQTWLTDRDRR